MKETEMKKILMMLTVCFASQAGALTPDEVAAQFPVVQQGPCTDNETGDGGTCFLFRSEDGFYVVFVQNGEPVFMRHVVPPEPYVEVWRAPAGISL